MGEDGYVTMEDLADRWNTADEARASSPTDLDFNPPAHGVTAEEGKFIAMRVYQCVRHAKALVSTGLGLGLNTIAPTAPHASTTGGTSGLETLCDRKQLLLDWDAKIKLPRPRLEFQGSDSFLKAQYKLCAKGEIGWFNIKHIVSALPEMDERPIKTKRTITINGWDREEEEEERRNPTTYEQLKRAHQVFRNTLLLCTTAFPQFAQFDATFEDLEEWYSWFWGKTIAERKPQPSEMVLMYAERNAWREIHNKVYEGKTLKKAMDEQRQGRPTNDSNSKRTKPLRPSPVLAKASTKKVARDPPGLPFKANGPRVRWGHPPKANLLRGNPNPRPHSGQPLGPR